MSGKVKNCSRLLSDGKKLGTKFKFMIFSKKMLNFAISILAKIFKILIKYFSAMIVAWI